MILIDDNSNDRTKEIMTDYQDSLTVSSMTYI